MDAGEFFKSPQFWANPKALEETFHEDFMHLRETEMLTRDEFLQYMQTDFAKDATLISTQGKILYEDEKCAVFEHVVRRTSSERKVTLVCLKKDRKVWRQMLTTEESND